jgi:hypothetical protein
VALTDAVPVRLAVALAVGVRVVGAEPVLVAVAVAVGGGVLLMLPVPLALPLADELAAVLDEGEGVALWRLAMLRPRYVTDAR